MADKQRISAAQFKKNVVLSIAVQLVSLCVGLLLNLVVPRFISEYQYAYWQGFVLYLGYVGILHFGLLDGLVLRYSQYDYEELDKEKLRSQFASLLVLTGGIMIIGITGAMFFSDAISRKTIIFVALGIVTRNVFTYSSYTFQITNQINKYSVLVIVQRLSYGVTVALLLIFGVDRFEWFCIAELLGDVVGVMLALLFNKDIFVGRILPLQETAKELMRNVSAGFILMLANWSSSLLTGGAKMIIQWRWDELTFGKISFSFSVSSLFLIFISAVSVVLFPSLKRLRQEDLPSLYGSIRGGITPVLYFMMLFYFPGCWILEIILPSYAPSLSYLATLLPIIIYSSQVSLLTNNYLKAYRKEKSMLVVNMISIAVASVLFFVSAYVFSDLQLVLVCIVIAMMVYAILSEIIVMKTIGVWFVKEYLAETIMTAAFIVIANSFERWTACGLYAILVMVYFIYKRKDLLPIWNQAKKIFWRDSK